MPEDSDYSPAPWSANTSFASARAAYDATAGRSYAEAVSKNLKPSDVVPKTVESKSENPIVILCDVTGSMGGWPPTIFSKLGYLAHEVKAYYGEDHEVCFGAITDVHGDKYPLQVQPFGKGEQMGEALKKFIFGGGGGGAGSEGANESYGEAGLYFARNCSMPNVINKPLLIIIGDEGVYSHTAPENAMAYAHVGIERRIGADEIFAELKEKFDVFIIRKNYGGGEEHRIQRQWTDYLGDDHVAPLDAPERVVDVIFGIFARHTNKIDMFKKELVDRQGKDAGGKQKIDITLKALNTIHRDPQKSMKKLPSGAVSVTRRNGPAGKTSKSLLDD